LCVRQASAAKERGEVGKQGQRTDILPDKKKLASVADVGLSHKETHEARQIRDRQATGILLQSLK
jgi:hypothetical protein